MGLGGQLRVRAAAGAQIKSISIRRRFIQTMERGRRRTPSARSRDAVRVLKEGGFQSFRGNGGGQK